MTPELSWLAWSVVLLFVHIIVQASFSDLTKGIGWALGPRDERRPAPNVYVDRIERSLWNFLQTYPAFIALALALTVSGLGTETTALGAAIWFWARVAYVPAFASGIPLVRSVSFIVSLVGLVMMLLPLL